MLQIEGYQVTDLIHSGLRSIIYRAIRDSDQKNVVLKTTRHPKAKFLEQRRYQSEFELFKKLEIDGLCKIYDLIYTEEGQPVFVMEDINGLSLDLLLKNGTLDLNTILDISIKFAEALDVLHIKGIIHCNVKPSNAIYCPETGDFRLLDLSVCSRIIWHEKNYSKASALEIAPEYMAPEQTNRTAHLADYRGDIYSLGITIYQLLTKRLPFEHYNYEDLMHAHIARSPIPPITYAPQIPPMLSQLVMKLMAKNPQDRYQSAYGVKLDLEYLRTKLISSEPIETFTLESLVQTPILRISDKFYGREAEFARLKSLLATAQTGQSQYCLISGEAGVGKTALVREFQNYLISQDILFAYGKYDQYHHIPHEALLQAFQKIAQQILASQGELFEKWKLHLAADLGEFAAPIIQMIPEFECLLGSYQHRSTLNTQTGHNLNRFALRRLLQSITKKRTLVILLDDMQWASQHTIDLLENIFSDLHSERLLLIGLYRESDLDESSEKNKPFAKVVQKIRQTDVQNLVELKLQPVTRSELSELLTDTLGDINNPDELLQKIAQKTICNPFFVRRLLWTIYERKILFIDPKQRKWVWDVDKMPADLFGVNVLDVVIRSFKQLPNELQLLLKEASCIGNKFDVQTLSQLSHNSIDNTISLLNQAVTSDVIYLDDKDKSAENLHYYNFINDVVREAIYSSLESSEKAKLHSQVGLFWLNTDPTHTKYSIFELVNQLNLGIAHLQEPQIIMQLINLNLEAGQQARQTGAYNIAQQYLKTGIKLLPPDSWQNEYELTSKLYINAVATEQFCEDDQSAEEIEDIALQHVRNVEERVGIYKSIIQRLIFRGKHEQALIKTIEALRMFAPDYPLYTDDQALNQIAAQEQSEVAALMSKYTSPHELLDLPQLTDSHIHAQIQLLIDIAPLSGLFEKFFGALIPRMLRLCLEYGNCQYSALCYMYYAFLLAQRRDFRAADDFGKLAFEINDRDGCVQIRPALEHLYGSYVCHWMYPLETAIKHCERSIELGIRYGSFNVAGWAILHSVILLSLKGNNLQSTIEQIQEYLKTAREILKFKNVINFVSAILFGLVELTGQKEREDIVRLVGVDREDFIEQLDHYVMTIPYIYLQRAMVATLLEQQSDVAKYCQEAEKNIAMTKGSSMELELCFYKGLWLTNKYPQQPPEEQAESLVQITEYLHTLQELSSVATHYRHKYLLLKAKFMLITGDYLQACMLFDQAIEKAEKQHCLYVVALSLEYMLCFLDEHKKSLMMRGYLIKASEIYQIWGSYSKLIDLEKWHPESQWKEGKYLAYRQLLNVSQNNPMYLDFESLLKTNQMISKQYKIEDLLYHLLSIIFKSIGAAKGILFSLCDNEYVVEAHIAIPDPLGQPNDPKKAYLVDYPESIINYVKLNKRRIIIPNTSKHYQFQHDPYLSQLPHSSIICSPIIKNNTLMAILYLENNQLPDTFTEKNCHILEMISGQLAISIENARYCMSLEQKVKEQTDEWKNKQANFIYSGKLANLVDIVFGATNEFNNSAHYTKMAAANIQDKAIEFQQFLYSVIEEKEVAFREIIQRYLKHIIDNTTYILGGVDKTINIIKYLSDFIARDKTEYMSYDIVDGFNKTAELFLIRYQSDVNLIIDLPESLEIKCYPQEINQVFMIILTNAGQAIIDKQKQTNSSQKGDIKVTFIRQDEYYFRIEISDNGCGMDKITSSRLFDSFFTTRGPEHFGLGLHIAQNMIEKCHGSISAKSNSGEGTTFRIHLPFHP